MHAFPATIRLDGRLPIVLGAGLTQFMVIGLLFSYGVFFKSLEIEFGWSRTLLSACSSLAFLVMGTLAFAGGYLNDRYGPRLVLMATGTVYGIGYALLSQVSQPWQLFALFGLFIGAGLATHDVVTLSTIARRFHRRRGIMTGVVKVGTATGQIVVPPASAFLIALYDWRLALIILGAVTIVLLVLAAQMMHSPPARDVTRDGSGDGTGQNTDIGGFRLGEARRSPVLWMICAVQFCSFASLTTVPLHIVVHGMDLGMTPALAATLLSVVGATSIAGRMAIGGMVDRIGGRRALALCFLPLIVSLVSLLLTTAPMLLFVAIGIYGFAHGGLFTVTSPTVAEYFGLKAHGAIFGLVLFSGTIGGAAGPILAGRIFDQTGSYAPAFTALAALAALGLVFVHRLPKPDPAGHAA